MTLEELEKPDMPELARICRDLFIKYATLDPACSALRKSAVRQQERFSTWEESDLAVFAPSNASFDRDEVRALAIEQLSMIRTNLEFAALNDPEFPDTMGVLSFPEETQRREWIKQLEGTPSEALDAVRATIDRLVKLGEAIRQRPALNHESQLEDPTETDGEGSDLMSIKRVVQSNSPTASPSLQHHLVASILQRHISLQQLMRQGQQPTRTQQTTNRGGASTPTESSEGGSNSPKSQSNRQSRRDVVQDTPRPHSSFNSTPRSSRPSLGESSIASSSQRSITAMADDDCVDYPKPPKAEHGKPAPQCSYCYEVLESSDLSQPAWKRHVNKDLKPYICLFDNCNQRNPSFQDDETWANHMKHSHGTNWPDKLRNSLNKPQATGTQSSSAKSRVELVCPLCDSWPLTKGAKLPDKCWIESYRLGRVSEHIANHLLRLAFDSSDNLKENARQTCPSSSSEEIGTRSGQEAPSLNSENPGNGESESPVGSGGSFNQDEPRVSGAIEVPEEHRPVTANERTMQPPSRPLNSGYPQSLSSLVERAKELFYKRKYQEAEEEYRKALKSHAEAMEADDSCIISIKGNLANTLAKQDKDQEAEDLYGEIRALSAKTLGETHPHTLSCRSNLASLLERKKKYTEAAAIHGDVWELRKDTLGGGHPDTLSSNNKLANALTRLKRFNEATLIYEETLETRRVVLGEVHPDTIITLGNLANSLQNQGHYKEANAKYTEAMRLGRKVLDDEHPHLQWIRTRLDEALRIEAEQ